MLGFKPGGIIVEDSAGTVVETGQIVYPDVNTVVLTFSDQSGPVSFGGTAYVS